MLSRYSSYIDLNSEEFTELYAEVTRELKGFVSIAVKHPDAALKINDSEAGWFLALIDKFEFQFTKVWIVDRELYPYLDRCNNADPLMRLASHAFLHISYDLPRVIATSFSWTHLPRPHHGISYIPPLKNRFRTVFLRPAPLFRKAFLASAKKGTLGFMGRLVGLFEPAEILAYWVISLRTVAFIHAEILADDPSARKLLEKQIIEGIDDASKKAFSKKWLKLLQVPKLDNNTIFQLLPPTALLDNPFVTIGLLGTTILTLLFTLFGIRRTILLNRLDYFGYLVHQNLSKIGTPTNENNNRG